MFNNTVSLIAPGATVPTVVTTLIDGPTNRRTSRAGAAGKLQFSIAHTESKENPGFVTQRSNVRIESVIDVPESDKSVKAYVQFTSSVPKDLMTTVQLQELAARLVNFLMSGDASPDNSVQMNELNAVPRLFAGEP